MERGWERGGRDRAGIGEGNRDESGTVGRIQYGQYEQVTKMDEWGSGMRLEVSVVPGDSVLATELTRFDARQWPQSPAAASHRDSLPRLPQAKTNTAQSPQAGPPRALLVPPSYALFPQQARHDATPKQKRIPSNACLASLGLLTD